MVVVVVLFPKKSDSGCFRFRGWFAMRRDEKGILAIVGHARLALIQKLFLFDFLYK